MPLLPSSFRSAPPAGNAAALPSFLAKTAQLRRCRQLRSQPLLEPSARLLEVQIQAIDEGQIRQERVLMRGTPISKDLAEHLVVLRGG